MIQCSECEYFKEDENNRRIFLCDPFTNIKEPECLMKWQLLRLDLLVSNHQTTLEWQKKIAPIQNKILKYVSREINDIEESDSWKYEDNDEGPDQPLF